MSKHETHHDTGTKPVSFTAPLILGSITVFIILLFVSLGDPDNCCCDENCSTECTEACEKGDHDKHPGSEAKSGEEKNGEKPAGESGHH